MKEVRLPVEAAAPIPHHPEVRAQPEALHTVLPAEAHPPADLSVAAVVVAEAQAVAAVVDAQVEVADNNKQSELSLKHW